MANSERPSSLNRSERPSRTPIHGLRDVLTVRGQEAGWHYCWVADYLLDRFIAAAYEFVNHDIIVGDRKLDKASQIDGKYAMKTGENSIYLMRLPEELYKQDTAELEARIDESEKALRQSSKGDGRYGSVDLYRGRHRVGD